MAGEGSKFSLADLQREAVQHHGHGPLALLPHRRLVGKAGLIQAQRYQLLLIEALDLPLLSGLSAVLRKALRLPQALRAGHHAVKLRHDAGDVGKGRLDLSHQLQHRHHRAVAEGPAHQVHGAVDRAAGCGPLDDQAEAQIAEVGKVISADPGVHMRLHQLLCQLLALFFHAEAAQHQLASQPLLQEGAQAAVGLLDALVQRLQHPPEGVGQQHHQQAARDQHHRKAWFQNNKRRHRTHKPDQQACQVRQDRCGGSGHHGGVVGQPVHPLAGVQRRDRGIVLPQQLCEKPLLQAVFQVSCAVFLQEAAHSPQQQLRQHQAYQQQRAADQAVPVPCHSLVDQAPQQKGIEHARYAKDHLNQHQHGHPDPVRP